MPTSPASLAPLSLDEVNTMSQEDFVAHFGVLFENSPWIAHDTWPARPFSSRGDLLAKCTTTLRRAGSARQIELIQAHPDLAGRLARRGGLSSDSTAEQASAGLDRLTPDEVRQFEDYNHKYREKFGFPFVICARLNDKRAILLAFQKRLQLAREAEVQSALEEIEKIAALRLTPLVRP